MDEKFKKKYGIYDGIDTSTFKHIPEISFYNNNYFVGLKRDKNVTNDLLSHTVMMITKQTGMFKMEVLLHILATSLQTRE